MTSKKPSNILENEERPNDIFGRFLLLVVTYLAICGGVILLIIVLVNFFSIAGRVLFGKPLTGDFELVEMGCAVAIFSFLPLCQFKGGNVIVDFFTIKLHERKIAFLNGIASFIFFIVSLIASFISIITESSLSINHTLSRTIMTSLTTLLALSSLFIFGGEVVRGFVSAMIWGVIIGTYSSIFIASPLIALLGYKIIKKNQ